MKYTCTRTTMAEVHLPGGFFERVHGRGVKGGLKVFGLVLK
jgi:hypothetical protein